MVYILRYHKSYDAIVNYLAKKTKVDKGWIEQTKHKKIFIGTKDYEKYFSSIR
jgi:hypothetical protein